MALADAVGDGAIGKILYGHLARNRRGISPLIIFDDQHEWRALRGGEAQAFVKRAGGAAAVADPCERDDILSEIAAGHGDAGHYRNQIAEHGNGRDDVADFQVAEVAGAVFALGRRSIFRHVLGENVARRDAFYQQRADIADHRRDPIAFFQGIAGADGDGFLAQTGIEAADNFILAEQAHHALFELAIELHVIVEIEVLLAREAVGSCPAPFMPCSAFSSNTLAGSMALSSVSDVILQFFFEFGARHGDHLAIEYLAEMRGQLRPDFIAAHGAIQHAFERRGALPGNAARHDQIKVSQIGRHIVREAVRSHPAAQVHAERCQFFFACGRCRPKCRGGPATRRAVTSKSAVARIIASSSCSTYQRTSRRCSARSRIG